MNRDRKLRASAAGKRGSTLVPKTGHRLSHMAAMIERHSRIQRVIEVQRAHKLRHG